MFKLINRSGNIDFLLGAVVLLIATLALVSMSSAWHRQIASLHNKGELAAVLEQRLARMRVRINTTPPTQFLRDYATLTSSPVEFNPLLSKNLNDPLEFHAIFQMNTEQELKLSEVEYVINYEIQLLKANPVGDELMNCNQACRLEEVAVIHVQIRATRKSPHITTVAGNEFRDLYISI